MSSDDAYGDPATRDRILRITEALVAEKGAGFTLSEVADRASVSRQAVYLHFGDRAGLLVALVQHMDDTLDLGVALARVQAAADGASLLEAAMRLNTTFWAAVFQVAQVLEAAQHGSDEALAAAWRDRMRFRLGTFRAMVSVLAERGELDPGWTIDEAAQMLYAVAHFDTWRELVRELGWSDDQYVASMTRLLRRALLRN